MDSKDFQMADDNGTLADNTDSQLRRLTSGEVKLRRGKAVPSSGQFRRANFNFIDKFGKLDIRSSSIGKKGSTPSVIMDGNFGYTSTSSSITLYWDGTNGSAVFVIYRPDGTKQVVPQSNITVSALTPSTTYYFLPYFNTHGCQGGNVAFAQGDSGSPQILFLTKTGLAAASQAFQSNEAMSDGYMTVATAAGGSTGSGANGGSRRTYADGCPHSSMKVEERVRGIIRAEHVKVGDHLASPDGDGWMRVTRSDAESCNEWVLISTDDESIVVSSSTDIPLLGGINVKACDIKLFDELVIRDGVSGTVTGVSWVQTMDDSKIVIAGKPLTDGHHPSYWLGRDKPSIASANQLSKF